MPGYKKVTTPIIPVEQFSAKRSGPAQLDFEAIATFTCLGFFLECDTFYKNEEILRPAHHYELDGGGNVAKAQPYFTWHYNPRNTSFKQTVEEFAHLFETIVAEQTKGRQVILPLSGGLDSRTQAAALRHRGDCVVSYSYEFRNGIPEASYGEAIAKYAGFRFQKLTVEKGYLWPRIEHLAELNQCYSEFTHPRQMAFIDEYAGMGDLFSLGHWGDVLFDDMRVEGDLNSDEQTKVMLKKIIKPGGIELANALWEAWGLSGKFEDNLAQRVEALMGSIRIYDANARIRAFKSLYWAPRWTSVNLQVFSSVRPIALPYYDERMCRFICTVSEQWLAGRRIQLEYLKMSAPGLARIPWQAHSPFNLYNYKWDKAPWNLHLRIGKKMTGIARQLAKGRRMTLRNWELQFVGADNDQWLRHWLFENEAFHELVPLPVVRRFYDKFMNSDAHRYSHPVSMLLTLSLFAHRKKGLVL